MKLVAASDNFAHPWCTDCLDKKDVDPTTPEAGAEGWIPIFDTDDWRYELGADCSQCHEPLDLG